MAQLHRSRIRILEDATLTSRIRSLKDLERSFSRLRNSPRNEEDRRVKVDQCELREGKPGSEGKIAKRVKGKSI